MSLFEVSAIILTLAAMASYLNHRFLRLPSTIGVMLIPLLVSLLLILVSKMGLRLDDYVRPVLAQINFSDVLFNGMLSFLLFAGALHIDLRVLRKEAWSVAALATFAVVISTFLVAAMMFLALGALDLAVPFLPCLIFGALISPTDPIAVLALLKQAHASPELETRIAGESLFNDGVGVVIFVVLYEMFAGDPGTASNGWHVARLLLQEGVGGIVLGVILGFIAYRLLKSVEDYRVEVLLTLSLAMGGYALANSLHTSGPLAIVAAGLVVGNHGRAYAMSEETRENVDTFWELIDEILNAVLFVLIGLEVLVLPFPKVYLIAGLLAIPAVLLARFVSVSATVGALRLGRMLGPQRVLILTWGGLRGGISVALALSVPEQAHRDLFLTMTYSVVVFSILVQGLTMPRLLARAFAPAKAVADS
ncbi:MAG: sodium:proton antiporter [Verrucomicrobiota bacterium]|nr:sodium:proton antiporter [Verrucomicrobiota bacterium]